MVRFPWSSKDEEASFKPLESNAGFVLDIERHKVIALKLPGELAKEIAGRDSTISQGILSKLKAKFAHNDETEQWLTVTNIDNPLLNDYDRFGTLVVQRLRAATGIAVPMSNLAISASVPITSMEPPEALAVAEKGAQHNPGPPTVSA
jgi:hypothetical protein